MSHRTVYFLSDAHLGARYIADPRAHEARVVRMLNAFAADATHIYLLGDILDYWFEYRTVVPRGYVRFLGALANVVDKGIKVTWIRGNHDIWLFDYLRDEIGLEIIDRSLTTVLDGKRFYLAHGDDLGRFTNSKFKMIQSVFRNRFCQKLYSAIHPRWTIPFAHAWSSDSREASGKEYKVWRGDEAEPSMVFAKEYLREVDPDINYFIMGHRHLAYKKSISKKCEFILLGDCFETYSYAKWDGETVHIKQFDG